MMSMVWICAALCGCIPVQIERIPLRLGEHQIAVQLADTEALRQRGLMGQEPPLQHGMLLLYPAPAPMSLWMKNTPAALDAAFLDQHWKIVKIVRMEPHSEQLHEAPGLVIGALEMPAGWFKDHGIQQGAVVQHCQPVRAHCML